MKKFLSFLAAGLLLTACSNDDFAPSYEGQEQEVTLSFEVPENIQSRAADYTGTSAQGGVTNLNGKELTFNVALYYQGDKDEAVSTPAWVGTATGAKTATFKPTLVIGKKYRVVAYADYGTTSWGSAKGAVEMPVAAVINDESKDAYFCDETVVAEAFMNATLYRPYGKVRLVTTDMEEAFKQFNATAIKDIKVTYSTEIESTFNPLTGEFGGTTAAYSDNAEINKYTENDGETTLTIDYVPAPAENSRFVSFTVDVEFDNGEKYSREFAMDIPVKRNYVTTLIGAFFTSEAQLEIDVDDAFSGEESVEMWDGKATEPTYDAETNTYYIANASEFAGFIELSYTKKLENVTVELTGDIDFSGLEIQPVAAMGSKVKVNGNGHKVSNYVITEGDGNGKNRALFHSMVGSIDGINIENATINGTGRCAALVGQIYGNVTNCSAKNVSVTVACEIGANGYYEDADKAAALVAQVCEPTSIYTVSNCSVENATIYGYRDLGSIVGYSNKALAFENNSATDVTITVDMYKHLPYEEGKAQNYAEFVGNQPSNTGTATNVKIVFDAPVYIGGQGYATVAAALKAATSGDVIKVKAGTYSALSGVPAGVTIECEDGVIFEGMSSASGEGVTIKNAHFTNTTTKGLYSEYYCLTSSLNNTTFEDCWFDANSGMRWVYPKGDKVTFTRCTFGNSTCFRGAHFDGMSADVEYNNCKFYGFNAFTKESVEGKKITFNTCEFYKGASYAVVNMYGTYEYNNCKFGTEMHTDCATNGVVAAYNGCKYTDESLNVTNLVRYDYDASTCTITFDGVRLAANQTCLESIMAAGAEEVLLAEGTYDLDALTWKNAITINGSSKTGSILEMSQASYDNSGYALAFNNLTFDIKSMAFDPESTYSAIYRTKGLDITSCIIKGCLTLCGYETTNITGCDFVNTTEGGFNGYGLFYYGYDGSTVNLRECTFDMVSKAIVIYNHSKSAHSIEYKLNVADCTFKASKTADKAAIQMHTETGSIYGTVKISGNTTATGFYDPNNNGGLWQELKNNASKEKTCYFNIWEGETQVQTATTDGQFAN